MTASAALFALLGLLAYAAAAALVIWFVIWQIKRTREHSRRLDALERREEGEE